MVYEEIDLECAVCGEVTVHIGSQGSKEAVCGVCDSVNTFWEE